MMRCPILRQLEILYDRLGQARLIRLGHDRYAELCQAAREANDRLCYPDRPSYPDRCRFRGMWCEEDTTLEPHEIAWDAAPAPLPPQSDWNKSGHQYQHGYNHCRYCGLERIEFELRPTICPAMIPRPVVLVSGTRVATLSFRQ